MMILTWAAKYNVEIKTVDTDARIVLDTQVNVFLNAEAKVSSSGEVLLPQFVLTNLEKKLQKLKSQY